MNASTVAATLPRGPAWLHRYMAWQQRHALILSICAVLGAYAALDASWRETLKSGLVFALGSYPICRLLQARMRRIVYRSWITLFALDAGIKAFLINVYGTQPDTAIVIDAISNTTTEEVLEFIQQYMPLLSQYLLATGALLGLLLWLSPDAPALRQGKPAWAIVILVLFAGLHVNPTFRDSNPVFFWPAQLWSYHHFETMLTLLHAKRVAAEKKLAQWQPVYTGPAQNTVAIVIGESTNRWNWQLYGYSRPTTPKLMHETSDALVFKDVISGAFGTVASFRLMLTPRSIRAPMDDESQPSVLMLAKAAGYKTFWLSNQQDRFINARYADEADVVHLANTGGGRSDRKLDEDILPFWNEALKDPAPRKMIFVHLLGAHAHYDLRSPESFHRFSGLNDSVMTRMRRDKRSLWVRLLRNSYDNAMLYQDTIIAGLLHSLKAAVGSGGSGAFLYTPDHAEEVGHTRDFAGHAASESGASVPLIVWTSPAIDSANKRLLEQRPFQTDVLDWTLLELAQIRTREDQPQLQLLGPQFVAQTRYIDGHPYIPSGLPHD